MKADSNVYQVLWVATSKFTSFLFSLLSAAILSRYLDKGDYGTYRQILYIYNTLVVIFAAGLPRVFEFFLPRYPRDEGKSIVEKITIMLGLLGLSFSLSLLMGANLFAEVLNNPGLESGLRYFSPVPFFLFPTLGIEGIYATYRRTIYLTVYQFVSRAILLVCVVLPVLFIGARLSIVIYGWVAASALILPVTLYFKHIPFRRVKSRKSTLRLASVFSYSISLMIASIAGVAIRAADQYYVSHYFGAEVFAEYANGFMQIPFIGMITSSVSLVLMATYSRMVHENRSRSEIAKLWESSLAKSALVIYPVVVFCIFNADLIVLSLYGGKYANSSFYFRVAMVVNFFNIVMFAPLLLGLGEHRFYARLQMLGAASAWFAGYAAVKCTYSPRSVAYVAAFVPIASVVIALIKVSEVVGVNLKRLVPWKLLARVGIFSTLASVSISLADRLFLRSQGALFILLVNSLLFTMLMLLISRFFGVGYVRYLRTAFGVTRWSQKGLDT